MSNFAEQDARAILEKVVALSKADECTARLAGGVNGNVRFALNNVSTSGVVSDASLEVQVAYGKRVGIATINQFDDASLTRTVRRAEELAKLAPENEEFMPALEKQNYKPTPSYDESVAAITPEYRATVAAQSIAPCRADKLVAAGFLTDSATSPPSPTATAISVTRGRPISTIRARCAPLTAAGRAGSAATSAASHNSTRTPPSVQASKRPRVPRARRRSSRASTP